MEKSLTNIILFKNNNNYEIILIMVANRYGRTEAPNKVSVLLQENLKK